MTNHPVHIVDEDGSFSPTAMIPFCDFGGNMSAMGVKIDQFDVPVCSSFKAKLYKDQLCYSVDPNKFKDKIDLEGQLSLTLAIDYNKDRIFEFPPETGISREEHQEQFDGFDNIYRNFSDTIILETISNMKTKICISL